MNVNRSPVHSEKIIEFFNKYIMIGILWMIGTSFIYISLQIHGPWSFGFLKSIFQFAPIFLLSVIVLPNYFGRLKGHVFYRYGMVSYALSQLFYYLDTAGFIPGGFGGMLCLFSWGIFLFAAVKFREEFYRKRLY
jgi:hypothetical protein